MGYCIVSLLNDDVALRVSPIVKYLKRRGDGGVSLLLLKPDQFSDFDADSDFSTLGLDDVRQLSFSELKDSFQSADHIYIFLTKQPLFSKYNSSLLFLYWLCKSKKILSRFNLILLRKCLDNPAFQKRERVIASWQAIVNSAVDLLIDVLSLGFYLGLLPFLLFDKAQRGNLVPSLDAPRKILFVRMDHLGDIICTLPALSALRRKYPDAEITFLGAPWSLQPLQSSQVEVNHVVSWPAPWHDKGKRFFIGPRGLFSFWRQLKTLRAEAFDLVVQPRGDSLDVCLAALSGAKTRISGVDSRRRLARCLIRFIDYPLVHNPFRTYHISDWGDLAVEKAGCDLESKDYLDHYSDSAECNSISELIAKQANGRRVTIFVIGAGGKPREWPVNRFSRLISELLREDVLPVLVGAPGDAPRAEQIQIETGSKCLNLIGKTDFINLPAVLKTADLVITPDTSVMHLASLLGKDVVAIFSSGNLELAKPIYGGAKIVKKELGCSGCGDRCLFGDRYPCIDLVRTSDVLEAVQTSLRRAGSKTIQKG